MLEVDALSSMPDGEEFRLHKNLGELIERIEKEKGIPQTEIIRKAKRDGSASGTSYDIIWQCVGLGLSVGLGGLIGFTAYPILTNIFSVSDLLPKIFIGGCILYSNFDVNTKS